METRLLNQFINSWGDDYQNARDYIASLPEGKINVETYSQHDEESCNHLSRKTEALLQAQRSFKEKGRGIRAN